ncbi:MAG: choice-of-anchor B family protein [Gemmatimonadota bacterium]|nr:choice-of-anchor B family protein [Gemmatimonadota bacterium]
MKRTLFIAAAAVGITACGDSVAGPDGVDSDLVATCGGGFADVYPCDGIDLWGHLPLGALDPGLQNATSLSDVWGWTDPVTGVEYALVARANGVTFVDISTPRTPMPIARLASPTPASNWRDLKTYADHVYIVADGAPTHGIQIFDLTRLRDLDEFTVVEEDGRYTGVSSAHNIAINEETGFAYSVGNNSGGDTCGGGLHMIDLADPKAPAFAGCFADLETGFGLTGYTHDVQCVVYRGPDADHVGREVCIGANETAVVISDVSDKANPVKLGVGTYPDFGYVHQGWLSEDHRYYYQNDEADEVAGHTELTRMLVWDVTDLDDPVLVKEHLGPSGAIDHNLYVHDGLIYHSNYTFGIRVLDISDPADPMERARFDTVPESDATGFGGSWSNYPFFESGAIAVTSAREGLFILRLRQ